MKKRMGFVSNSSTSSFCIFGVHFKDLSEITNDEDGNEVHDQDSYSLYKKCQKLGLQFVDCSEYNDGCFIGLKWPSIKDDETGFEFKKRAKNAVEKLTGKVKDCATHEGTNWSPILIQNVTL